VFMNTACGGNDDDDDDGADADAAADDDAEEEEEEEEAEEEEEEDDKCCAPSVVAVASNSQGAIYWPGLQRLFACRGPSLGAESYLSLSPLEGAHCWDADAST
jgi:hypothetical protein